jgi:hypothetical protein
MQAWLYLPLPCLLCLFFTGASCTLDRYALPLPLNYSPPYAWRRHGETGVIMCGWRLPGMRVPMANVVNTAAGCRLPASSPSTIAMFYLLPFGNRRAAGL